MPEATEKVELLNAFFASVLTARGGFRNPRPWWQERKPGEMRNSPCLKWIGLEFIEANLSHTHPWSPKGCAHECWGELEMLLLSIISERLWRTRELPEDWRKANVTSVFKRG